MDKMYWYMEYIKVFAGYIALLYIWPSIIFRKYLRGKGLTFRFMFCSIVQIILINTVVLGLGLLHILNEWTVRGMFWGTLAISFGLSLREKSEKRSIFLSFLAGRCGWKMLLVRIWEHQKQIFSKFKNKYKDYFVKYILLSLIMLYGIAYFSYGPFQQHSYGCGDLYVHHSWIYGLQQGKIFADGIYPHAMHCFIYSMHTLFGIKVYSCLLFVGCIHILTFLTAIYCFLKKIFCWQYTPLFVLAAYLTFDSRGGIDSMVRLQWTLSQEFGFYLVFLCPLLLLYFLQIDEKEIKETKFQSRDISLLFMLGVGAAVSTHFYSLFMAFVICLAISIVHFRQFFCLKKVRKTLVIIFSGLGTGMMPMLLAAASGAKIQGSLKWGMKVIEGTAKEAAVVDGIQNDFSVIRIMKVIAEKGYIYLYGEKAGTGIILVLAVSVIVLGIFGAIEGIRCKKGKKRRIPSGVVIRYLSMILASFFFMVLFAAPYIGLPELISIFRLCSIIQGLILASLCIPLDFFLYLTACNLDPKVMKLETALVCVMIYCSAFLFCFHRYLYCELTRYNATVSVTNRIMDTYPKHSYTIVSTTDELYQVIDRGWHEELLRFIEEISGEEYYLPTEYIFLYVEKHPIKHGQRYFFCGPLWLAGGNQALSGAAQSQGQSPEIVHSEISEKEADKTIQYHENLYKNYRDLHNRVIIESKVYQWYQSFAQLYPAETSIYYEDEDFVCYKIHQDAQSMLNLALGVGGNYGDS